ncbi:hypothetical protein CK203_023752 [Vitis vinifera]|uniref:Disease resistance protein n=1 Tax=Vitis vinifera TaxID=29760 RepID=A0A438JA63_VITVI|nr:hypothetical protein CK203_023752 [Vitis vinifera]
MGHSCYRGMEGAVVGLAVKAYDEGTKFAGYIKGKNDYVNDLEGNYLELKRVVGTLKARRDDVEAEVNRDKRLQATRECQDWILRVKEIEIELTKKSAEVRCLLAEGNFERGVVIAKLVKPVEKMGTLNIEDKQSLHTVFQKTLSYLKHDKIRRIGIWGVVGIGKTAIMQYLNDNEGIAKMFDIIVGITPRSPRGNPAQHPPMRHVARQLSIREALGGKTQAILSHFRQPVIACIPPSAKGKDKNDGKSSPTISDSRLQSNDDSATASAPS